MCRSWVRRWRAAPVRPRWPRRCPTRADSAFWPAAISARSAWPTTSCQHARRPPARSASTCSCPSPAWPTSSRWTTTPRRSTSWPSTTTSKSAIRNSVTTTAGNRSSRWSPTFGPSWCRSRSVRRRRMCCAGSVHWECCCTSPSRRPTRPGWPSRRGPTAWSFRDRTRAGIAARSRPTWNREPRR